MAERSLRVTLVRSLIGRKPSHKACARGLGIRRIHQPVLVPDTPENRGMVDKIAYMLRVEHV